MFAQADYYEDCVYYLWNKNQGGQQFRYDTTLAMGKFCIPSETALAEEALAQGMQ